MGLIAIHLFRKALKDSPLWIPTKLETLSLFLLRKLAHHHGKN